MNIEHELNMKNMITIDRHDLIDALKPIYNLVTPNNITHDKAKFNLRGNITNKSVISNNRIIAGYASVIEVDNEKQMIPKEALEDGIKSLLEDSDYSNLMLTHQNIQIGKILSEYDNLTTHVDDNGLFIICQVRQDLEIADIIWESIIDGNINGLSIAGEILMSHIECDDSQCVKVIDKINIFEVSICTKPVNIKSGFIIVSKSECPECTLGDVSKYLNEGVQEMVKESEDQPVEVETVENTSEESTEEVETVEESEVVEAADEPETSIKSVIESLSRDMESIKGIIDEMRNASVSHEEIETVEEAESEEEEDEEIESEEEEEEEPEVVEESNDNVTKEEFDSLKKSIDILTESVSKIVKLDELELAIKSKEDEILSIRKRVDIIENAEKPSQTIDEEVEPVIEVGEVESEEYEPDIHLVKDTLSIGAYYKELDY